MNADVDDTINVDTALKLVNGDQPMACCPRDGEPLISTFEFRGAEFVCMVCGTKYGWLAPSPKPWTQELQDRHDELKVRYDRERAEREANR